MSVRRRRVLIVISLLILSLAVALPVVNAGVEAACGPFSDVAASNPFCSSIIRILNLGITQGCGPGLFCPTQNMPREQMAAFMARLTTASTTGSEPFIFNIDHGGYGSGAMIARSNDGDGLRGTSYGASIADNGVRGETNSTDSGEAGVKGYNTAAGPGVYGYNSAGTGYGVRGYSATNSGVSGASTSGYGVRGASDTDAGGYFTSAEYDGVWGVSSRDDGPFYGGYLTADYGYGVFANTDANTGSTYAVYAADNIYVAGSCTGCRMAAVALNGGDETLEPGDLVAVAGIADPISPESNVPVIVVQRAEGAADGALFGVVEGHFLSELATREIEHTQIRYEEVVGEEGEVDFRPVEDITVEEVVVENASMVIEAAAPGEYVTILYSGMAQVKVDASAGAIQAGDSLVAGLGQGFAAKAGARGSAESVSFATALEPLADGTGLIWALVNLR